MCCLFFLEIVGDWIYSGLSRPRPYGIRIIGPWGGYSAPSPPVAVLTLFLVGAVYCLVVPGRPRTWAKIAVAVVVAAFGLARLYLAIDHPDDVLFGVALGVAIPVAAFRFFTPNEVFPVVYRRGRTAHVDVTGRRGAAIREAVRDQLGLTVLEIRPVGLASSAGSTPVRLRVEGGEQEYLFAKLYTKGHVRADQAYKLWRSIRYGSLEDERAFQTVRRLAEYEDYTLRLLRDVGIRTARTSIMLPRSTACRHGDGRTWTNATSISSSSWPWTMRLPGLMSRCAMPASQSLRISTSPWSITASSMSASPISTASLKNSVTTRYSRSGVISTIPYGLAVRIPTSRSSRRV